MQICLNMQHNGSFNANSTTIDEKSPMSIIVRTVSDCKTLELLEAASDYIKQQGLREQVITTNINQILKDAGCKPLSAEQVKELITGAKKPGCSEGGVIMGEEPLKDVNQAMGSK